MWLFPFRLSPPKTVESSFHHELLLIFQERKEEWKKMT